MLPTPIRYITQTSGWGKCGQVVSIRASRGTQASVKIARFPNQLVQGAGIENPQNRPVVIGDSRRPRRAYRQSDRAPGGVTALHCSSSAASNRNGRSGFRRSRMLPAASLRQPTDGAPRRTDLRHHRGGGRKGSKWQPLPTTTRGTPCMHTPQHATRMTIGHIGADWRGFGCNEVPQSGRDAQAERVI